jgi:hypothetical protein
MLEGVKNVYGGMDTILRDSTPVHIFFYMYTCTLITGIQEHQEQGTMTTPYQESQTQS